MDQSAISVQELRKSFGENHAVQGVSFDVAAGEIFSLLGPNGAGKTTGTFLCSLLVVDNEGKGEPNHFIRNVSHMVNG